MLNDQSEQVQATVGRLQVGTGLSDVGKSAEDSHYHPWGFPRTSDGKRSEGLELRTRVLWLMCGR